MCLIVSESEYRSNDVRCAFKNIKGDVDRDNVLAEYKKELVLHSKEFVERMEDFIKTDTFKQMLSDENNLRVCKKCSHYKTKDR